MNNLRRKSLSKRQLVESSKSDTGEKKKKKNVIEIDGVMWLLDEHGNPLKRLKKKLKNGEDSGKKKKKNVQDIDGQLWLCDKDGNRIKRIRKKQRDDDNDSSEHRGGAKKDRGRSKSRNGRKKGYNSESSIGRLRGRKDREFTRLKSADSDDTSDESFSNSGSRNRRRQNMRSKSRSRRERKGYESEGTLEKLMSQNKITNQGGEALPHKKKKKGVREIDGQLWLCDDDGNKIKKVRKKGGGGHDSELDQRSRSKSRGQRGRSISKGPLVKGDDDSYSRRRRHEPASDYREYTDEKGRKHIWENGIESVFDKHGKKLRKKTDKKEQSREPNRSPSRPVDDFDPVTSLENDGERELEFGIFDHLWNDTSFSISGKESTDVRENATRNWADTASPLSPAPPRKSDLAPFAISPGEGSARLSEKISSIDEQNRSLQLQLITAKEEMKEMAEQRRKEKAKNVKAMTDMLQLKADYYEASSELSQLRNKVTDLQKMIEGKEQELATSKEEAAKAVFDPNNNEGIAQLEAQKSKLASKLEVTKAHSNQEIKKKEEQLAHMNREMLVLRNEVEMLVTGQKGGGAADPIMTRLLREKREFEEKYNQEKEVNEIKVSSLQEMIDTLETMNAELNKQMLMNKEGNEEKLNGSNHGARQAYAERRGRRNSFAKRPPEPSKSFDFASVSPGTLFGAFGRRPSVQQ
jgi:hypothetical protein